MKTFFESAVQEELRQRLEKLQSQAGKEWGKMSPAQMLAHCTASMQVPVGDLHVKRNPLSLIGWMFKGMLVSAKPFTKNSPTTSEFRMKHDCSFEAEKARFQNSFDKLAKGPDTVTCHNHPFFGKMSAEDWGHLVYKHLDHHFRQFGV